MKRFGLVALTLITAAVVVFPAPVQASPPSAYPVLIIPGMNGALMPLVPLRDRLVADGFEVRHYFDFLGLRSNYDNSLIVADKVKSVAATTGKVNLACYSAGVMACRFAMKYLGIQDLVDRVVLFAGGDGNLAMCLLPVDMGGDGCRTHWFARSLLLGDDTPGPSEYYFITSFGLVTTPIPDGGVCYLHIPFDGFKHPDEPSQPIYQDAISNSLRGVCPGEFIDLPIRNF